MQKRRIVGPFSPTSPPVPAHSANSLPLVLPYKKRTTRTGPELTPALQEILSTAQRELGLDRSDEGFDPEHAEALLQQVAERLGFKLSGYERDIVLKELERDARPFGALDDLVRDPDVSDIIVAGYRSVQVQQGRANYSTDVEFPSQEAYEAFVERLLLKAGSSYSTKRPIADGMLGAFARLHVVHKSIAEAGPYLTIRLNRFSRVDTKALIQKGLAPESVFSYLETLVKRGITLLIVGEVGTGKTTLTRALAGSMPSHESILVIEDTPEIRLEHPHVRYVTTRSANTDGEGRVTPSEVIRGGMRMAMNRIVFGEIRDPEAAEAFIDVCSSGHPGLSTIHARSAADAVVRLQLFLGRAQKGVNKDVLNEQIATAVGALVFVDLCRVTRTRRIMEVREVGPVADGALRQKEIFRYETRGGFPAWRVVNVLSNFREYLEADDRGVALADLPPLVELSDFHLYRESQKVG